MVGEALRFGPFVFDRRRKLLMARGVPIQMGARALALLEVLLEARGGVVTRAELMNAAWPATSIEESNLTVQIAALRRSLSEASDGTEWIKTVPRVGYQFVGSIDNDEDGMDPQSDPDRTAPKPSKPKDRKQLQKLHRRQRLMSGEVRLNKLLHGGE